VYGPVCMEVWEGRDREVPPSSSQDWRTLVMKVAMTSSSAGEGNGLVRRRDAGLFSAFFSISTSILVARRSAATDLLMSRPPRAW
jgi:hypothetical protein